MSTSTETNFATAKNNVPRERDGDAAELVNAITNAAREVRYMNREMRTAALRERYRYRMEWVASVLSDFEFPLNDLDPDTRIRVPQVVRAMLKR